MGWPPPPEPCRRARPEPAAGALPPAPSRSRSAAAAGAPTGRSDLEWAHGALAASIPTDQLRRHRAPVPATSHAGRAGAPAPIAPTALGRRSSVLREIQKPSRRAIAAPPAPAAEPRRRKATQAEAARQLPGPATPLGPGHTGRPGPQPAADRSTWRGHPPLRQERPTAPPGRDTKASAVTRRPVTGALTRGPEARTSLGAVHPAASRRVSPRRHPASAKT